MNAAPGFYGKLPSHGDFVNRRLPRPFVEKWDDWLQTAIAASKVNLGDAWLDTYLTSPIWRFVLSSGVCGQESWTGVMMPSVDKVGRYFPLTLAVSLPERSNAIQIANDPAGWFESAESLALSALDEENFDLEAFSEEVEKLGEIEMLPLTYRIDGPARETDGLAWHVELSDGENPAGECTALLDALLRRQFDRVSLWWSTGSEQVNPSMLACAGLPPSAGFSSLLSGDWRADLWNSWQSVIMQGPDSTIPGLLS